MYEASNATSEYDSTNLQPKNEFERYTFIRSFAPAGGACSVSRLASWCSQIINPLSDTDQTVLAVLITTAHSTSTQVGVGWERLRPRLRPRLG